MGAAATNAKHRRQEHHATRQRDQARAPARTPLPSTRVPRRSRTGLRPQARLRAPRGSRPRGALRQNQVRTAEAADERDGIAHARVLGRQHRPSPFQRRQADHARGEQRRPHARQSQQHRRGIPKAGTRWRSARAEATTRSSRFSAARRRRPRPAPEPVLLLRPARWCGRSGARVAVRVNRMLQRRVRRNPATACR